MPDTKHPYLLYADDKGQIYEDTSLWVVGRVSCENVLIPDSDFIPLPEGSDFFHLPGRRGIGYDPKTKQFRECKKGWAVAAFVAPAYTLTHQAAWTTEASCSSFASLCLCSHWMDGKRFLYHRFPHRSRHSAGLRSV